jgi:hypothetical protein
MMHTPSLETARENLSYIRKTMEAAGQFTAVPGTCLMAAGVAALAGVSINLLITGAPWDKGALLPAALNAWGVVLGISATIVSIGIYRKSRNMGIPLQVPLIRKLLWSLCPAMFVGGVLTNLAVRTHNLDWLPAIWLGCYGVAVTNGGQVSVAPVRYMGVSLLAASLGAAASPARMGLFWLAAGFGWLHLVFGAYIARRHNG